MSARGGIDLCRMRIQAAVVVEDLHVVLGQVPPTPRDGRREAVAAGMVDTTSGRRRAR